MGVGAILAPTAVTPVVGLPPTQPRRAIPANGVGSELHCSRARRRECATVSATRHNAPAMGRHEDPNADGAGPTSDLRQRLIDSALTEFALYGYENASLRRIASAAGAKHGNVRHIFGSKDALLGAVIDDQFAPLHAARRESLEQLLEANPDPTPAEIFDAAAGPFTRSILSDKGALRARFSLHGFTEHEAFWPHVRRVAVGVQEMFIDALVRALPGVPEEEAVFRWQTVSMQYYISLVPTAKNVETPATPSEEQVARLRRYAITTLMDPLRDDPELHVMPPGCHDRP